MAQQKISKAQRKLAFEFAAELTELITRCPDVQSRNELRRIRHFVYFTFGISFELKRQKVWLMISESSATIADIVAEIGISESDVGEVVAALKEAGVIEQTTMRLGPGRPQYLIIASVTKDEFFKIFPRVE